VGGFEAGALASVEPSLRYHPDRAVVLTWARDPGRGQCQVGSLTGAVGNRASSARAEAGLTVRPTSRAGAKAGPSDPVVPSGRAIAQRIKGTPGITG
jgi:hypothetical protein